MRYFEFLKILKHLLLSFWEINLTDLKGRVILIFLLIC